MSIKKLNESIDNLLNEVEVSKVEIKPTFEEELRKSLKETLDYCIRNDMFLYSIADSFADRIESMVPDKRWWEITDCDFYTEMFNTGDFNSVINCIIDELKPEYKQNVNESYNPEPDEVTDFKKAVESADTIDDIQFLIYELSDGVAEEACQVAFDNITNSDENDIDTIKDAVISAIDIYLEDNEFNEAYQKDDTDSIKIDDSILKKSDKFKYQLLDRMRTDCNYFLGAGKGAEKFLWAGNVPEQIAYMKAIYNSFPDNKKPEWISLADIDEYEKKMLNLDESLDVDDDEYYVGDDETGRIYYGKSSALKAFNELKADGIDAVMNKIEDDSINDLKETYEEPELLGKGYAAPTSMDYVSNIKRLVKNKVTDFTDIQNLMQKTMDDIDAFDNYWKVHKAAIMKNIKEVQDLIPTEYRI